MGLYGLQNLTGIQVELNIVVARLRTNNRLGKEDDQRTKGGKINNHVGYFVIGTLCRWEILYTGGYIV